MNDLWHWLDRLIWAQVAIAVTALAVWLCSLARAYAAEWVCIGAFVVALAVWLYYVLRWVRCWRSVRRG